jgi:hypothetical protein
MRSVLALGLLITLYAFANATSASHSHRRHAVVSVKQSVGVSTAPGFAYAPAGPLVRDQPAPFEPGPYDNRYPNWGGM